MLLAGAAIPFLKTSEMFSGFPPYKRFKLSKAFNCRHEIKLEAR